MEKDTKRDIQELAKDLEEDMMNQYGPMVRGKELCQVLGYPSLAAMRQAIARNKVPIPIFPLENRRGKFALVKDVAFWLAEKRISAVNRVLKEK